MSERIRPITMPKWGMTMTEGKVTGWLSAPGERIEKGQDIVEIETEKITNVVEAEVAGTLRRIVVPEGHSAACGALIAVLAEPDTEEAEIDAFLGRAATAAPARDDAPGGPVVSEVEAGGQKLRVVTSTGPREATPAVLLHGFGADAAAWLFTQEALAAHRTVMAVELPSHGGSRVDAACVSVPDLAACLRAAVETLAPGGVHLVGHSLGGRLALRLAAELGERARSLALVAPAGFGSRVDAAFLDRFVTADRRRPMKAALQQLVADPATISSEMIERTLAYKRIDGVPAALSAIADASLRDGAAEAGVADDLARLRAPVLVLWGERDAVLPVPSNAPCPLRVIEGAGHMPQMEKAGAVNAALIAHMAAAQ